MLILGHRPVVRTFPTTPERLFGYLTEPQHLSQWFAPDPSIVIEVRRLELTVDGSYCIAMFDPGKEATHVVVGTYRQIEPPRRLVFS